MPKATTRLQDLDVQEVSFVPRGANRQRKWLVMKGDEAMVKREVVEKALVLLTEALAEANKGAVAKGEIVDQKVEDAAQLLGANVTPPAPTSDPASTAALAGIEKSLAALAEIAKGQSAPPAPIGKEFMERIAKIEGAVAKVGDQVVAMGKTQEGVTKALEGMDARIRNQAEQVRKMAQAVEPPSPVQKNDSQHRSDVSWNGDLAVK